MISSIHVEERSRIRLKDSIAKLKERLATCPESEEIHEIVQKQEERNIVASENLNEVLLATDLTK